MSNVNTLKYNGNEIKYMRKDDSSAYICLKDICDTLGLLNSNNVGKRIPDEYKEYVDVKYELTHDSLGNPIYRDIPTVFIASKGIELFLNTSRKRELAGNLLNWLKNINLIHSEIDDNILNLQDVKGIRGYVDENNVVYLNLEDVCRGLGFTRISHSGYEVILWYRVKEYLEYIENMGGVCDLHKDGHYIYSKGLPEYISENVYYMLAMKANNHTAFKFQSKIANEVLPMIRRTGMYMTEQVYNRLVSDPTKLGEMMLDYGRVKKELEDNRYKMDSYDRFMDSKQSYSMASVAKTITYINPNDNKIIGRNQLFSILRDLNILQSGKDNWNMPYQNFVDLRYFKIDVREVNTKNETVFIRQVRILPKGIEFIINVLKENGYQVSEYDIPDKIE